MNFDSDQTPDSHASEDWRIAYFTNELSVDLPQRSRDDIEGAVRRAMSELSEQRDRQSLKTRILQILDEARPAPQKVGDTNRVTKA